MLSIIVDGKVLDFTYKKGAAGFWNFYIGDIFVGQVINTKRGGWTAISHVKESDLLGFRSIDGFKSRYTASEYLLRVGGFYETNN